MDAAFWMWPDFRQLRIDWITSTWVAVVKVMVVVVGGWWWFVVGELVRRRSSDILLP